MQLLSHSKVKNETQSALKFDFLQDRHMLLG